MFIIGIYLFLFLALLLSTFKLTYCCDAGYYLEIGLRIFEDGLFYDDYYSGYRSYFAPIIFGGLQKIFLLSFQSYDYAIKAVRIFLCFFYVLAMTGTSIFVLKREGIKSSLTYSLPIAFNPAVLHMVSLPMQESLIAIFCFPVIIILLSIRRGSLSFCLAWLLFFGIIGYLIRSSLLWLLVPCLAYAIMSYRRYLNKDISLGNISALRRTIILCVLLFIPQCWISYAKFASFNPYPSVSTATDQIAWGIGAFKYQTVISKDSAVGLFYPTPFKYTPENNRGLGFYFSNPGAGLLLATTHVWVGLHPDTYKVFLSPKDIRPVSFTVLVSAVIVGLGLVGLFGAARTSPFDPGSIFLLLMFAMSCAYTALIATETRFGIFGYIAVSVAAVQLLATREGRRAALISLPLVLAYAVISLILNALLVYRTSWPDIG